MKDEGEIIVCQDYINTELNLISQVLLFYVLVFV